MCRIYNGFHRRSYTSFKMGCKLRNTFLQVGEGGKVCHKSLNFFPCDSCCFKVPQMAYTSLVYFDFKQRCKLKNDIGIMLRVLIRRIKDLSKQHYLVMLWKLIFPLCLPKMEFILFTVYRPLVLFKHRRIPSKHILFIF